MNELPLIIKTPGGLDDPVRVGHSWAITTGGVLGELIYFVMHACLLDALDMQRVAVVGASAGTPSSMRFALRHPERTAVLVLLVPAAYPIHVGQRPNIPHARFVSYPTGGHLWVGHQKEVMAEIAGFLRMNNHQTLDSL